MEIERMREPAISYSRTSEAVEIKTDVAAETDAVETEATVELGVGADTENAEKSTLTGNNTQIKKAVDEINKKAHNSEAIFGIHDATNRVTIKIVDKDSKEVLKEYPPEKTLDMIAKVWEVAGLLVDEKL